MHNFKTVIAFEFFRTVNKKTFWLSTLAIPVVVLAVFAIIFFSNKTASETEQRTSTEQYKVTILDKSGLLKKDVLNSVSAQTISSREAGIQAVKDGSFDSFIYYPLDPSTQTIEVYGKDVGLAKNGKYLSLARQLLKSSIISDLESSKVATLLQNEPATKLTAYKNGAVAQGYEQVIVPGLFLVLFYLVIILMGNHMLTSTTEEKENRVIEIILTSVDAISLILGKIISMVLVGILQITAMSLPFIIGFVFFKDKLNLPQINFAELVIDPIRLLIGALLFIFSFLLFTGTLVTIGAVVPTAKEAGNFFGIAIFFMVIPFYAMMAIITDPSQFIVKVFSFFPMTAPITLMLRNAVGNLTTAETALGIAIIAVSSIASLFVATRAFRYGTLEYERKLSLKRIFRA